MYAARRPVDAGRLVNVNTRGARMDGFEPCLPAAVDVAGAASCRQRVAAELDAALGSHRGSLAVARVAGETAPLLFTAFGNRFWSTDLGKPMASLPVQIYTYAVSPYEDWHTKAWGSALILIAVIALFSFLTRVASARAK